jgi:hypothetical protein
MSAATGSIVRINGSSETIRIDEERICNLTELDEYAEGFRKVATVSASLMQTIDAIAPLSHETKSIHLDIEGLADILSTINMCALYDWWVHGKKESQEHTNFMAISTVLQTALTSKFLASFSHVTADKMAWICDTIGSIPVIGQGIGILEAVSYGYNAVHHVNQYKVNRAEVAEHQSTVQKVQNQLFVLQQLSEGFEKAGASEIILQRAIERDFPEEAQVTAHVLDDKIKLRYLNAHWTSKVTVLTGKIANLDIKQNMIMVSLVNDISHIVSGILTILGSILLMAGSSAAVAVNGIPLALCAFIACSISLSKLVYHKHCEKQISRRPSVEIPAIVKMAQDAKNSNLFLKLNS